MLGIIDRYLLAEAAKFFLAIIAVLLLVVTSMLFLRTLEEVNVGALSVHLVLRFLGYQVVRDIGSVLPPAFFLAVLMTLSRLSRDSELIALGACGIGPGRQLRTLLLLALPVALCTGWISIGLKPWAATGIHQIRLQQQDQGAQIAGLQPGRFYVEERGDLILYIGSIDRAQQLGDVFILDRRDAIEHLIISQGGRHLIEADTGDHIVILARGHRFDGNPGAGAFRISEFEEYRVRIRAQRPAPAVTSKRTAMPTTVLARSPDPGDRAELEHRFAAPLAVIVLTIVAIPLVTLSPRERGAGRLLLALLAYFSFFNLQRLAEGWMADGITPLWLTSYWYQALILIVVYLVLLPESLWLKRILWWLRPRRAVDQSRRAPEPSHS